MESPSANTEHVVLIRDKLLRKREDLFISNIAIALRQLGLTVTILTTYFDGKHSKNGFEFLDGIKIERAANWIPRSIFGLFTSLLQKIISAWIAFRIIFSPPQPRPSILIVDNSLMVFFLKTFSSYRVFYVEHFPEMKRLEEIGGKISLVPNLLNAMWIQLADEIIVENECIAKAFKKFLPNISKDLAILTPCIDVGPWKNPIINIDRIVPDLLKNDVIFLAFGMYRKPTNFMLAVDAFEILLKLMKKESMKEQVHMIVAGKCKTPEERNNYNKLIMASKMKFCADRLTILTQFPVAVQKALIYRSTVVILPSRTAYADFLLASMSLGKPIIALSKGVANSIIENKVSGILVDHANPMLFSSVMYKLIFSKSYRMFMGEVSKKIFEENYSFETFTKKVEYLIQKYSQK